MSGPDPRELPDKPGLRRRARRARAALTTAYRRQASARITALALADGRLRAARTVFVYLATPEEVATRRLIDALVATGRQVLVPLTDRGGHMSAVPFPGWTRLAPGPLGIDSPPRGPAWTAPVDVALVPGLAFTRSGHRLGFGAGYYDRWLAAHPGTCALGLCYDAQLFAHLPQAGHDRAMNGLITESGRIAVK